MSPLDRPVPPAGEDIHIPGPSIQPLLLTVGITAAPRLWITFDRVSGWMMLYAVIARKA